MFRSILILTIILLAQIPSAFCAVSPVSLLERAETLSAGSRYAEAITVFDSLLSIPHLRNSIRFQALEGRARCRKFTADYGGATADYLSALEIPASPANKNALRLNYSDLLIVTGRYDEAEKLLSPMLDGDTIPRALSNLAAIRKYQGHTDESIRLYNLLLQLPSSLGDKVSAAQNLGVLLMSTGDARQAVETLRSAAKMLDEDKDADMNLTQKDFTKGILLANLSLALAMNREFDDALSANNQALAVLKESVGDRHPDYLNALRKRGEILLIANDRKAALECFKPYFLQVREYVSSAFPSMSEQSRLDYWKKIRPLISEVFATGNINPDFLLDVALTRRAIALTGADKAFGTKMKEKLSPTSASLRKALKRNEVAVDFIIYPEISSHGSSTDRLAAIVAFPANSKPTRFVDLGNVSDISATRMSGQTLSYHLKSENYQSKNVLYSDTTLYNLIWDKILNNLPAKTVVHFAPDGFLNLLAIESLAIPQGSEKGFSFRRHTTLANLINRNNKKATGKLLVAGGLDYDIYPSRPSETPASAINHDAAEYLSRHLNGRPFSFRTLPGMRKEALRVAQLSKDVILRDTLSEEFFKHLPKEIRSIHLSTHGYTLAIEENATPLLMRDSLSADNSLLASGLVLSGANVLHTDPSREDALLSAREICDLDLSHLDFTVLAACQTALGTVNDEGPAGLIRGLKKAGAGTILATLWEVDDNATLLFMTMFHKALADGSSPSEAITDARRCLRDYEIREEVVESRFDPATLCSVFEPTGEYRSTFPYRDPAYWAPFILIDD